MFKKVTLHMNVIDQDLHTNGWADVPGLADSPIEGDYSEVPIVLAFMAAGHLGVDVEDLDFTTSTSFFGDKPVVEPWTNPIASTRGYDPASAEELRALNTIAYMRHFTWLTASKAPHPIREIVALDYSGGAVAIDFHRRAAYASTATEAATMLHTRVAPDKPGHPTTPVVQHPLEILHRDEALHALAPDGDITTILAMLAGARPLDRDQANHLAGCALDALGLI